MHKKTSAILWIPQALKVFLSKRMRETLGLCLLSASVFFCVSLLSYDPEDFSWNTAVRGPVKNVLGEWGAYAGDFLWQYCGGASVLIIALLTVWGVRFLVHQPLRLWILKILMFLMAFSFLSLALQVFQFYTGILGLFLETLWNTWKVKTPYVKATLLFSVIFLGIGVYIYTLSISWNTWKRLGRSLVQSLMQSLKTIIPLGYWSFKKIWEFLRFLVRIVASLIPSPQANGSQRQEPVFSDMSSEESQGAHGTSLALASHSGSDSLTEGSSKPHISLASGSGVFSSKETPGSFKEDPGEDFLDVLPLMDQEGAYQLPPLNLLQIPAQEPTHGLMTREELEQNAVELKKVLGDFGIRGDVVSVRPGPVVTLYELIPAPGIKASRIISLADDIARSMSALSARVAVIPGKNALGIELPNIKRQTVHLRELFADKIYEEAGDTLSLVLGKDISGQGVIQDLAKMPHLLVAGTTGSGKSVSMNAMILSLLFKLTPDQCKLIMIDPKMLEFSIYDGIPHLLTPVVTDPKKAIVALKWVVREMENRYRSMSEMGVRNIYGYNGRLKEASERGESLKRRVQTGFDAATGKPVFEDQQLPTIPLPHIVVVVDEMADLMLVAGKEVEAAIQRLAQMARAAGIHLIMATQRPSVDVITGTIKANFPTRMSFQVTSKIDSRTILGEGGAEQLLGQGDMLFMAAGGRINRIHGPFVSDRDVEKVVRFLKAQAMPQYVNTVTEESAELSLLDVGVQDNESDGLFAQAVDIVRRERKASTSFIQRCLQIGYNRAARLVEQMEKEGIVSEANHVGRREVLIPPLEDA